MNKIDLLFIGGVFPKDEEKIIIQKSSNYVQSAANNCQWRFINGFDAILNNPVTILNQMFIGSFPYNYSEAIIKERFFSHIPGAKDINLGFINIMGIKQLLRPSREKHYIKEWLHNCKGKKIIFIYSLSNKTIRIARLVKRISKDAVVVTYVGDLPENFMKGRQKHWLIRKWVSLQAKRVDHNLNLIDFYVLVSKEQAIRLKLDNDKYIIIEALANSKNHSFSMLDNDRSKIIVYAGGLLPQYNIQGLLEAFSMITDTSASLVIMGDGPEKEKVLMAQNNDKRIIYKGVVSQEEAFEEMKKAWTLVNPTLAGQGFTQSSFPIKIIDYLLAGRPVISQKLEGIPDEYDEYLMYFGNQNSLYDKLKEVLEMDITQVNNVGYKNYTFVTSEKSEIAQTRKLLERIV